MDDQQIALTPRSEQMATEFQAWKLDAPELVEEMKHEFLGEVLDMETNTYKQSKAYGPKMNALGADEIAFRLRRYLNKIQPQTNYTEDDIMFMLAQLKRSFVFDLVNNYDKWLIDLRDADHIYYTLTHSATANIKRSLDAGEREAMTKPQSERFVEKHMIPQIMQPMQESEKKESKSWGWGL